MQKKLYKDLWRMGFQKMLALEESSISEYQSLLDEFRSQIQEHPFHIHLERLISDEKKHIRLIQELVAILERQKESDEIEAEE